MIKKFQEYFKESISFPTTKDQVVKLCKKYKIKNYSINPDFSIDVEGNVNLSYLSLKSLPLRFSRVEGYFDCRYNLLTTLEGSPREVKYLHCSNNPVMEILNKFPDPNKALKLWDDFNVVRNGNELSVYRFKEMYLDLTGREFKGDLVFKGYKVVE